MEINNEKIRYILQYYFDKGKNANYAREKICGVYGEGTLSRSAAKKWFTRFRSGNMDVKDAPRSGRPSTGKIDEIIQEIEGNRHISSHEIAKKLNIHHQTVLNHLQKAGYKKKLGVWELIETNVIDDTKNK